MAFISFYIFFYIKDCKTLKLIACSPEIISFSEIGEGVKRRNTINLLVFSRVLINASDYLEAAF